MAQPEKIEVTEAMVMEALGGERFNVPARLRQQIALGLTKKLNPPLWSVVGKDNVGAPVVRFHNTLIDLQVYTNNGKPDQARRLHIAEMVCECLNQRGLVVE